MESSQERDQRTHRGTVRITSGKTAMIPILSRIFQKKGLRKYASHIPTGMTPLSSVRSVTVLLDSEDPASAECAGAAGSFFGKYGIRTDIRYIDTRSSRQKKTGPATDPGATFQRKDLNWYGRLKKKAMNTIMHPGTDLYIDLTSRDDYTVQFTATAFPAKFKIGSTTAERFPFDLVVSSSGSPGSTSIQIFNEIATLLLTIR